MAGDRALNATQRAYAELRRRILAGELPPGSPIGEERLAALVGVSRTPIREAIRRLEAELLIRRLGPRRAIVAGWSADDVAEMFALRGLLEAHAAARAARCHDAADIAYLVACNADLAAAIDRPAPDIDAFVAANRAFHARIVAAAASPRLAEMLARLIEQPVVALTARLYEPVQLLRSQDEHAELLDAFRHRDADWAAAVMTGHIRRAFHTFAARR